jgi:hypothetical protein
MIVALHDSLTRTVPHTTTRPTRHKSGMADGGGGGWTVVRGTGVAKARKPKAKEAKAVQAAAPAAGLPQAAPGKGPAIATHVPMPAHARR